MMMVISLTEIDVMEHVQLKSVEMGLLILVKSVMMITFWMEIDVHQHVNKSTVVTIQFRTFELM